MQEGVVREIRTLRVMRREVESGGSGASPTYRASSRPYQGPTSWEAYSETRETDDAFAHAFCMSSINRCNCIRDALFCLPHADLASSEVTNF